MDGNSEHFRPQPPRGNEPILARRVIIDLDHFDKGFVDAVCEIFHTDYFKDGQNSKLLRGWIDFCIRDIVDLFSMNPDTLFGTINIGPDLKGMEPLGFNEDDWTDGELEEFSIAYKVFATNLYYSLSRKLGHLLTRAIDMGFDDISCEVERYQPGMVILSVRAHGEIKDY